MHIILREWVERMKNAGWSRSGVRGDPGRGSRMRIARSLIVLGSLIYAIGAIWLCVLLFGIALSLFLIPQ